MIVDKVRSTLCELGVKQGDSILVGLSGGADSVALLCSLCALREEMHLDISAAHLNHCLRGDESYRDEEFAVSVAGKLNVPITVERANVADIAEKGGMGIEECGRKLRYGMFGRLAKGYIATAHNQNDNTETVLLNVCRGSGIRGLCGIPARRGNIIRPLIYCTREEIERYLVRENMPFITDSTNYSDIYARNKIRLNVVPQLLKINDRLFESVTRLSRSANKDDEYLSGVASELLRDARLGDGYSVKKLKEAHAAIRHRAVSILLQNYTDKMIEYKHILSVDDILERGGRTMLVDCIMVRSAKGVLTVGFLKDDIEKWCVRLENGETDTPIGRIRAEIIDNNLSEGSISENVYNLYGNLYLDCDTISDVIFVRSRKEGDNIRIHGRNVGKSLKKLYNEAGIPPEQRNKVAVIAEDERVLAVQGMGVSEAAAVSDKTKRILKITFLEKQE